MTATTFATIVGLMSNFMSERRAKSDDEYKEFQQWLSDKRHKTLLDEINTNHLLGSQIKLLLKENHDVLEQKIDFLNDQLSTLASSIDGFSELSAITSPDQKLPKQCISILRTMNKVEASHLVESITMSDTSYLMPGTGKQLKAPDPRFIEDDFNTMVELRLLRPSISSRGNRMFYITRQAVELMKQIDSDADD